MPLRSRRASPRADRTWWRRSAGNSLGGILRRRKELRKQSIERGQRVGEIALADHERRRQDDEIAARDEGDVVLGERSFDEGLEWRRRLRPRRERRPRGAVGDQFDHREETASAPHIADGRVTLPEPFELREQIRSEPARAFDQPLVLVGGKRRYSRGASQRMPAISKARIEHLMLKLGADVG